ncbi:ATP-binding protein [bacterium]|nr:ATP-binding protein [bacterium]
MSARPTPAFLETIRAYYRSRQGNQILLTGNIWDIYQHPDDADRYINLIELLTGFLRDKMIVIIFDITKGIQFHQESEFEQFLDFYSRFGTARSTDQERRRWLVQQMRESMVYPLLGLSLLREFSKVVRTYRFHENNDFALFKNKPFCFIIRYAETVLPPIPLDKLSETDRQKVTLVRDWFSDRDFTESSDLCLLISDTNAEINQKIKDLPHLMSETVPYPDLEERKRYIRLLSRDYKEDVRMKETQTALAQMTAGLRLQGIEDVFLEAAHLRNQIDREAVINKVNQVLTRQIGDHIEILKPGHTLKDVLGNKLLKEKLKHLKARLKSFDPLIVPSGILVSGPNGVGKTFIFVALAAESGRIPVILKNLRSKWFGETDAIFEKINHVLRALGNVLIMVDEADTAFGGRGEQSHETEQRLFGNVLKMMSDTDNHGKIVWILLTARPDKLEPDFKRPGRCGLHIPVFDPEGQDRTEFIDFVLKKAKIDLKDFSESERLVLEQITRNYSGADFNEMASELKALTRLSSTPLAPSHVLDFIQDWRPADISQKRRLQTLQAMCHCSYKSLLPQEFKDFTPDMLEQEIKLLS